MTTGTAELHLCGAPLLDDYEGHCSHCDFPCPMIIGGIACICCARMMDPEHIQASARLWANADQYAAMVWDQTHPNGGK